MMTLSHRYGIVMGGMIAVVLAMIVRLVFLMIINHTFYLDRSEKQIQKLIKIDASRGKVLDRNGYPLALSVPAYSVYASPDSIPNKPVFAKAVAPMLGMAVEDVLAKVSQPGSFVWLRRKMDAVPMDRMKAMDPKQINVLSEERRIYPNAMLMSDVVGFVGMDGGLEGLEYQFDRFLTGEQGYYIIKGDPRGVRIISSDKTLVGLPKGFSQGERGGEASSLKGGNITTTIDYRIQFLVERLLADTIARVDAIAGQVIVMDVNEGDIIAMANYPLFDPNAFQSVNPSVLKNSCIVDVFEPGSIFKVITYAAALEEQVVTPGTMLAIPEFRVIQKRRIKEAHERSVDDPTHYEAEAILVQSMNVGTSLLADKMGKDAFYSYIQGFGFGEKTGIMLPGEARGIVRPLSTIAPIDLAVMSFGQGISVTALQMVAAIAAIGNNGVYVPPRVVKHLTDHNHLTLSTPRVMRPHRVISPQTAQQVRQAMKAVVDKGTGQYAAIPMVDVGGKTGTAQKPLINGRGYDDSAYVASFVGLLPIQNPRYAILVAIDTPKKTIWGSTAGAPLFAQVATVLVDFMTDIQPHKMTSSH